MASSDQIIDIPGVGQVAFPASMPDHEVSKAAKRLHDDAARSEVRATPAGIGLVNPATVGAANAGRAAAARVGMQSRHESECRPRGATPCANRDHGRGWCPGWWCGCSRGVESRRGHWRGCQDVLLRVVSEAARGWWHGLPVHHSPERLQDQWAPWRHSRSVRRVIVPLGKHRNAPLDDSNLSRRNFAMMSTPQRVAKS